MAQMIQQTASSKSHLEAADRHARLCSRIPSASFLAKDILPFHDALNVATGATAAKEKEADFAYDAIMYYDGSLDNEVYATFEACKKYDRESGTSPVFKSIFITGKLTDIKDAPVMEEPKYVKELVARLKALGPEHPLAECIPRLESKVADSEKAIGAYDAIVDEISRLKIQEEIAKRKLREQYRLNYLHAEEQLGKKVAELLFPVIRAYTKPVEAIIETQPQPAAVS